MLLALPALASTFAGIAALAAAAVGTGSGVGQQLDESLVCCLPAVAALKLQLACRRAGERQQKAAGGS